MTTTQPYSRAQDPVTFEVLRNAFSTVVDAMSEQILRTCYSFVIYSRDFSSALCDAQGNTVMQGSADIAVHVGTLHFKCKSVIEEFPNDIHPGDVFAINDPYRGGTHLPDVSFIRPIFVGDELIAFTQNNGHWADIGGSVPGSFDITAKEHFGEGLRITPIRIWSKGVFLHDVAKLLVSNTRSPETAMGDLQAQAEATAVGEREILRLVDKYGKDTIVTAMTEVQDYVEQIMRARLAALPDGTWSTIDFIDSDPAKPEGLVPVAVNMALQGDTVYYDFTGSAPAVASFLNCGFGTAFSGVIAGTKSFFPDLPLNSGFYRALSIDVGPEGTVVNAGWPHAVTGNCSGPYEKIMNATFELWSQVMPHRSIACSFNLEYLLLGGKDKRSQATPYFMWYDWMAGGWGGRINKDGASATSPVFGVGLAVQSCEGQERLCPVITTEHSIVTDSGGPGKFRGGCGVQKGGLLTEMEDTVVSYCCDRSYSVTWGINGGLPSIPQGLTLNPGTEREHYLGAVFSNIPVYAGDTFVRPSAGGGGLGDPLERDTQLVLEDVIDGYVSIERAKIDYGVVITPLDPAIDLYEIDEAVTAEARASIRAQRAELLQTDPELVAEKFRNKELNTMDVIRQYGVILDWNTGNLLVNTTTQFREMLDKRTVGSW